MKNLPYISLVLAAIVAIDELFYISVSSLAWVIIGLAVAVGLNSIAMLPKKQQFFKICLSPALGGVLVLW